ncbi:hypothetical protein HYV50_02525, partial [Candidatus Pacearchaeota archaeon]|nr:hypothetical protein [Candidatus Pacearchaeota archaeon]
IYVNVSVTETNEVNITFTLYNSTSSYNVTTFTTAQRTINWTGLADGLYTFNATVTDFANNRNTTTSRTVRVDTTVPSSIAFASPTNASGTNLSISLIKYNVTATDNGVIGTIIVRLFNSTRNQINSSTSSTSPLSGNFSGLSDGTYYINATVNDTSGNVNSTIDTRTIVLDTTAPSITLTKESSTTTSLTIAVSITESGSSVSSCSVTRSNGNPSITGSGNSWTVTESSLSAGISYTYDVSCTDYAGNSGSKSGSFTTDSSTGGSGGGGGGGGGSSTTSYTTTYAEDSFPLNSISAGVSKSLGARERVKLNVLGTTHYVGVPSGGIVNNKVTVEVTSTPERATLGVGETAKFDLDNNGYYDLSIGVKTIFNNKADLVITALNEKIQVQQPPVQQPTTQETQEQEGPQLAPESASAGKLGKVILVISILIAVCILIAIILYFRIKNKEKKAF